MRILLVNNYYPEHIGGIETIAASLAAGYRKDGHEVRWVAGDIGSRVHKAGPDDFPVRVWNGIEGLGFPYPLPSPGAAIAMRDHVRWADVVHLHDCLYALNVATFVASRRERTPVLLTQHVAKVPYRNALYRAMQATAYATIGRSVLSRVEQVVFVSDAVRKWFAQGVRFKRTPAIIENGVEAVTFQPLVASQRAAIRSEVGANGSRPLLLFVGRFVEKKGVRLLHPLIRATPQCDWLLIGRAGDVDPADWALPNLRVMSPQAPSQLRNYYAAADLLVLPSRGEGFPVVAQEAMACGTPALLGDITAGGLPSISDVVFTSHLTSDDLTSALRGALDAVTSDGDLRRRVAERAHTRWTTETMVSRYEEQLEALLR